MQYADAVKAFAQSVTATIHANDPGADIYFVGHSYGGGLALMAAALAELAGVPSAQIHVETLAPVGASGIFRDENLSINNVPLSNVISYVNVGDELRGLMSPDYFGNLMLTDQTASSQFNSSGQIVPSLADHSVCTYVKLVGQ